MTPSDLATRLQQNIDQKTKPPGALGQLEALAKQIGLIQQTETPDVSRPKAFVFGADHGVCAEGVNPFPQVVTEQMLANFATGGAAMNVFCRTNGIDLTIVNMGIVNSDARWPEVLHAAVAPGTANLAKGAAMTAEQCEQALSTGHQLATEAFEAGHNLLIIGEMGIGNTTSASALLSALTKLPPEQSVGPGTGADSATLDRKITVVRQAATRCASHSADQCLMELGGFEIAAMVGAIQASAETHRPVLIDGFIATIAALVAEKRQPGTVEACVFAHRSAEPAHRHVLDTLNAQPLLDLGLRLGEGSGAALAYPLVKNAVAMLNEMATFADAGVSGG
ncbi:nicotinate-nucleotide--dimethylbenzimidazole phosphoribosyltransferase [Reinekea blandensis]|uniref:Nicotinate-nucleotide--dimethylbenzimidazole phosphoribosyltransferase n=1 Tax=Reinekea blandensis MED297 TaxID=314283 RepID=A4BIB5_9GAMM|nr:nicotinate-nucleotide--dimethylbenzimidazole phosphoribosyltransferase [Reinekea blandensis]EAR08122.1 nicotinate-nucleotide--dimethylbenzimidazole phosphoribosyltransferase [Reinekea sp. MED297] [Reinekea blandensis MED297]